MGALQWATTQTAPHLSASISILCGNVSGASQSVSDAANKALRFSKSNADVGLVFQRLGPLQELCLLAISDAAWGVRTDHLSQGGFFILLAHRKVLEGEPDHQYVVLDWRSFKLPRVSRSSLNAEAQSYSAAVDSLEYVHIFWQACHNADFNLEHVKDNKRNSEHFLPNALIIDAKALYDAVKAEIPQIRGDKCTQIECMIVKQKLKDLNAQLRWVLSEVQLSDGLTKIQAQQLLADRLRSHKISLVADSTFQAAKRKTIQERKENSRRNAISVKKNLTMMIIANEFKPTMAQDEEQSPAVGWDFALLVMVTLLCIGLFQIIGWLQACWRQRRDLPPLTVEAETKTEDVPPQLAAPATPRRQESADRYEARIAQYKEFIKRGNEAMDQVRYEKELLETRCQQLSEEIELREHRDDFVEERMDEQQRMIRELETMLGEVSQQTAFIQNHIGGIPQRAFTTRTGTCYHLDSTCNALQQSHDVKEWSVCSFCGSRATPISRRPQPGSSGGT